MSPISPLDPLFALGGGLLIGFAAALLLIFSGRIAGISGIVARATGISNSGMPVGQALAFIVGLPVGAVVFGSWMRSPEIAVTSSVPLLITAGLLVGFGTRMGNGCTSGHGVCGVSRLSPRSLVATASFIFTGFAAVAASRFVTGA
ncbi:MAG: YeeE/YedE thiosulfate transporter family protein [Erythrobacter sp.]|uniref:YeeE/YedE family protein n=1 Tax=Erythrobacter sp. TaxID=1042 RepID=UPI00261E3FBD|nr:YeeE/YedE thiosulfate transporter family protein [Erythrobacter sp.]MDJ0977589.1 YeeE/YedE thiosulfate transporter family protein [Erythrobacter sp.]